jgi:hypothetical protein
MLDNQAPSARAAPVDLDAMELGWLPGSASIEPAWHWRRSGIEEQFTMAASGRFPMRQRRRGLAGEGVPTIGEWPGIRVTGRYATRRAEWCWAPAASGLTPHGMRHSLRTWMEGSRVHQVLAEAQMRHELAGIDVYRHVTDEMRAEYRGLSEEAWDDASGAVWRWLTGRRCGSSTGCCRSARRA